MKAHIYFIIIIPNLIHLIILLLLQAKTKIYISISKKYAYAGKNNGQLYVAVKFVRDTIIYLYNIYIDI
jgi:hypothetical protein